MKKIKCLFIDDQEKEIENQINSWEEDFSDEDSSLFQEFSFTFKKSNKKTNANDLIDECMAFDFIILDQMAASDDAGNGLAQAISSNLVGVISYCIYTNETGIDVRKTFKNVNIYKKEEKVTDKFKIEHDCDGGFIDMLKHIKSDTGFNKYCKFLRFTNNQNLEELIRNKLTPLMENYLGGGECKVIDNGHLLKFCTCLSEELINQGVVPDISYTKDYKGVNTTNIINYLISPKDVLEKWINLADPNDRKNSNFYAKMFFKGDDVNKISEKCVLKSVVSEVYLKRKKHNYTPGKFYFTTNDVKSVSDTFFSNLKIGNSFKNSLIGPSFDFIWTYRCSEGHEGQSDPDNRALKVVYESILMLCERLSIIFERINELKKSS